MRMTCRKCHCEQEIALTCQRCGKIFTAGKTRGPAAHPAAMPKNAKRSQRWPNARDREYAKQWRIGPRVAVRILNTGYSPEGMEILAIFARLEAKAKATKAVTPKEESCK